MLDNIKDHPDSPFAESLEKFKLKEGFAEEAFA